MRDVFDMWGNTRMVVLAAMTASLYAAILIPFKVLPIIPGVTEFRPANAVPVICSFLFGPAAAWGAAIGNVIGDFFGGIGPGDLFGFAGNFLYGFLPYKVWELVSSQDPVPTWHGRWTAYVFDPVWLALIGVIFVAAGACALVIGWGLNVFGFIPFAVLGNIVLINNLSVSLTLGLLLLSVLYPRVKRARLLYRDLLPAPAPRHRARGLAGLAVIIVAVVGGMTVGNLLSTGRWDLSFLPIPGIGRLSGSHAADPGLARMTNASIGLVPFILLLILGIVLL